MMLFLTCKPYGLKPQTKISFMKKLLFLLVATLLFSNGCGDDDNPTPTPTPEGATVNLNVKATFDGLSLQLFNPYPYPGGKKIRFQTFNFFISKITLLGQGITPDYELSEVEFFDFKDNLDLPTAQAGLTHTFEDVPVGVYTGVKVDFGVPADLNNADSGKLPTEHPLRKTFASHFWSDWGSYIFMKCEGIYDSNGDGVFNQSDVGFEHHPGTDQVLTTVTKFKQFDLVKGDTFDLNFSADVFNIYVKNSQALDLNDPANRNTQEASDMPLAIELMSRWETAWDWRD